MTDQEWLEKTAGQDEEPAPWEQPHEWDYPREAEAAARWGLHPHEARPRSGPTFLHERLTFLRSEERSRQFIRELMEGARALLDQACVLKDGLGGWYFFCRHCGGVSPEEGPRHAAHEDRIQHQPDCVAVRVREMVTSWPKRH